MDSKLIVISLRTALERLTQPNIQSYQSYMIEDFGHRSFIISIFYQIKLSLSFSSAAVSRAQSPSKTTVSVAAK